MKFARRRQARHVSRTGATGGRRGSAPSGRRVRVNIGVIVRGVGNRSGRTQPSRATDSRKVDARKEMPWRLTASGSIGGSHGIPGPRQNFGHGRQALRALLVCQSLRCACAEHNVAEGQNSAKPTEGEMQAEAGEVIGRRKRSMADMPVAISREGFGRGCRFRRHAISPRTAPSRRESVHWSDCRVVVDRLQGAASLRHRCRTTRRGCLNAPYPVRPRVDAVADDASRVDRVLATRKVSFGISQRSTPAPCAACREAATGSAPRHSARAGMRVRPNLGAEGLNMDVII